MLMIIPTCRAYGPEFMTKMSQVGSFTIQEEILDDELYLIDPTGEESLFYPLKELSFKLLKI